MAKKPAPKSAKAKAKVKRVMAEFKAGTLKSSSGEKVTDRDQALAIAMSEARKAEKLQSAAQGMTIDDRPVDELPRGRVLLEEAILGSDQQAES